MSASGVGHRLTRARKLIILAAASAFVLLVILVTLSPHGSTSAAPPRTARGFTLEALGHPGRKVSLSQYTGRPVMVNFFSSTCVPCRQEAPLLARFYRSHHGQVTIIGIDVADQASSALRFARQTGISYPIGTDPAAATAGTYGVAATPQTFFLSAGHRIVNRIFGPLTAHDLSTGLVQMR